MKHYIEPILNQYFSCHQIILATYASYKERKYDMIFSESWGFQYEKNDNPFCVSLNPGYQNRRNLLFEKFHSIKITDTQYTDKEHLKNLIQTILPDSPIILNCDVFDCPWNISYQRNHIDHYVLITGVDDKTKQFFILDPYSTENENIIDIDNLAPDNGYIYSFETLPLNNLQIEDYRLEIANNLDHIKNNSFFKNLENFYNEFQIRFDEVILSEYTDIYAVPLIINLRRISNQRYCHCISLKKMVSENIIDYSMVNIMESIAEKYGFLRTLLIKQIMKKKKNNECVGIINEIIYNEYDIYEKMKAFI